jgi:hypothetical protein
VRERRPDLSPWLDGIVRSAMAKDPEERPTMDELADELAAALAAPAQETMGPGAETMVLAPPRRRRRLRAARPRRGPVDRPNVWPLIVLLAGLAVLAGILAAVFTFTDSSSELSSLVGKHHKKKPATGAPVHLSGLTSYDPLGDGQEHSETARDATDGDPATAWTTEHYQGGLNKRGVGLVLDARAARKLSKLTIATDTPGYTAVIESSSSSSGGFTPVSRPQMVGSRTTFSLSGGSEQYYLVWITSLGSNDHADVSEVTARG